MMMTSLIKFENSNCSEILKFIGQLGYDVEKQGSKPVIADGIEFRRFIFRKQNAHAEGCIIIQQNNPDTIFINLSIDIRRIFKIWKLFSDQKLVREVRDILVRNGGVIAEEDNLPVGVK